MVDRPSIRAKVTSFRVITYKDTKNPWNGNAWLPPNYKKCFRHYYLKHFIYSVDSELFTINGYSFSKVIFSLPAVMALPSMVQPVKSTVIR